MKTNNLFLVKSGYQIQFIYIVFLLFIPTFNLWANNQTQNTFIEYLYIHTDKSIYTPDESIWFKAYVLNAENHTPSNFSKLLFINILDEAGKSILSSRFPISNGSANGDFQIPGNIKNGNYQLVAYTENQKQLPPAYWYLTDIEINSRPVDLWNIIYRHDSLDLANSSLSGSIFCLSQNGDPIQDAKLKISISSSETELYNKSIITDSLGKYLLSWSIPNLYANGEICLGIRAEFINETKRLNINIPLGKDGLDLQFYPESGNLVAGIENKIAFTSTDNFGNPINITGVLMNQKGNRLKEIISDRDGMGVFNITPLPNETYYVSINNPILKNAVYQLPKAIENGYTLSVKSSFRDQLSVIINMTDHFKGKRFKLELSNGVKSELLFNAILEKKTQVLITTENFPIGISTLTLYADGLPVAERLVFLNKHKKINLSVETNKENYAPREKVEIIIRATDFNGKPVSANLSIAIVDEKRIIDNQQDLIVNMLLGSQLKNVPETSAFLEGTQESDKLLNLLLMTRGWRKLELVAEYTKIVKSASNQNGITGKVFLKKNKGAKNVQVQVINTHSWQMISTQTDDEGRFVFPLEDYLEIADETNLSISAHIPNSNKKLRIEIDENLPENMAFDFKKDKSLIQVYDLQNKANQINAAGVAQKHMGFTNRDSIRVLLSEIEIKASKIEKHDRSELERNTMDYSKKADDMQMVTTSTAVNSGGTNPQLEMLGTLKQVYPFLFMQGGKVVSRGPSTFMASRESGMLVVIDGFESTMSQAVELANQIQEIKISTGPAAGLKYGSGHLSGVVEITLKKTEDYLVSLPNKELDKSLSVIQGFKIARRFNAPDYAVKDVAHGDFDVRSTIYWNPNLGTDNDGKAEFSFYNSDKRNKIKCIFMGVSNTGLLMNQQISYEVF